MNELNVNWGNRTVGRLNRDTRGRVRFRYSREWLKTDGPPVSLALPCRKKEYAPGISTAFFENLLPESTTREILAFNCRFDKKDIFAFLEHFGKDCAGALSIIRRGEKADFTPGQYEYIDPVLTETLNRMKSDPGRHRLFPGVKKARLSIAGAQDKLPVYLEDNKFYLPLNPGSATTHIIKPASPHFPEIQRNEAFCMDLAGSIGLNTPESRLINFQGHELFVVERYDRKRETHKIVRIHQEDFCQAMGLPVNRKYQEKGGPGFSECRELIDEHLPEQGVLIRGQFVSIMAFNFCIGNCDAHGKNFSIIHGDNLELAPFYDLVSTQIYPSLDNKYAMAVGQTFRHDRIREHSLRAFARQMKFRPQKCAEILAETAQSVDRNFARILDEHEKAYGPSPIYRELSRIIEKNTGRLVSLTEGF